MPEFYMIFARQINEMSEFCMIVTRKIDKCPRFYVTFAPKIFFSDFVGEQMSLPLSPTPMILSALF